MFRIIGLIALVACCRLSCFGQPPLPNVATVSHAPPADIVDGSGTVLPVSLPVGTPVPPLQYFDDFSWRWFIALNWPAKNDVRGIADQSKKPSDVGPRVWETWKAGYEIVPRSLNSDDLPKPWASFDGRTPCPDIATTDSGKQRILGVWHPFGDFNQAGFGFGDLTGPLVCQNKKYVRYEVRVNEPEYEFIRAEKLYLRSVIDGLNSPKRFPDGSVEVKAAWKEIADDEASKFYSVKAKVFNYDQADPLCETKTMGLVGFHIVHKTPLRPQWIWSSFEHVSNVPKFGAPPASTDSFSFNDPAKPQVTDSQLPAITAGNPPSNNPISTQVVREQKLHPPIASGSQIGTSAINDRYHAHPDIRGTVWENYNLVTTQWPTNTIDSSSDPNPPHDNFDGDPFPDMFGSETATSNTTLETYAQSVSCMGCHESSRSNNLDFVFFLDYHAFNDTALDSAQPRTLKSLRATILNNR